MKDKLTLLTFVLDQVWHALNVDEVQEVIPLPELTSLGDTPPFVSGVFNLRGHIVPAIDLRRRMGLKPLPWDVKTAVLIVRFQEKLYGLIVDEALSLITLSTQDTEVPPDFSPCMGSVQSPFVFRVGKLEGRLILILNLNRIFKVGEPRGLGDWHRQEDHR